MKTSIFYPEEMDKAADLLLKGEIVAFPTETVYGLGAVFDDEKAISKIFVAKGRPSDNPLILHIAHPDWILDIAQEFPPIANLLIEKFFPGPLTLILPKKNSVSPLVTGGRNSIAFRMPKHPLAIDLIKKVGKPLAAPSANLSGKPSSTSSAHVLYDFMGKIAGVVEGGKSCYGIESTVLSLLDPDRPLILRPGHITQEMVKSACNIDIEALSMTNKNQALHSPGTRYRHYAPRASITIIEQEEELQTHLQSPDGKAFLVPRGFPLSHCYMEELTEQNLYAFFRACDQKPIDTIIVYLQSGEKSNTALMNRLMKAQEK